MRIYLTQHGSALAKELDPDRSLSETGRTDVGRLATFLEQAGIRVEQVVHSGKTRAGQTASILAGTLLATGAPRARAGLGPMDAVEPLATEIPDWSADTLIVGHLPFLGRLASLLLTEDPDRPTLVFEPGSMACLERAADGHWALLWMIRPELLMPPRD